MGGSGSRGSKQEQHAQAGCEQSQSDTLVISETGQKKERNCSLTLYSKPNAAHGRKLQEATSTYSRLTAAPSLLTAAPPLLTKAPPHSSPSAGSCDMRWLPSSLPCTARAAREGGQQRAGEQLPAAGAMPSLELRCRAHRGPDFYFWGFRVKGYARTMDEW